MDQLILSKIMMKLGDLPALPQIANRVISLTEDPKTTSDDLSRLICQDQVLTSKVLRLVNSAYYGLHRKVPTISEAVTVLGMKTLRTLVLGVSVHKTLVSLKGKRAINPESIWRHSYACAVSSRLIALKTGICQEEYAFIAGLLHDIGKIVFNYFLPEEFAEAVKYSLAKESSMYEAETEIFKINHADIGRLVAEKWNLPDVLVEPIGSHHAPMTASEHHGIVQAVYLGDMLAVMAGYSETGSNRIQLDNKILEKLNLTYEMLYVLSEELKGNITVEF